MFPEIECFQCLPQNTWHKHPLPKLPFQKTSDCQDGAAGCDEALHSQCQPKQPGTSDWLVDWANAIPVWRWKAHQSHSRPRMVEAIPNITSQSYYPKHLPPKSSRAGVWWSNSNRDVTCMLFQAMYQMHLAESVPLSKKCAATSWDYPSLKCCWICDSNLFDDTGIARSPVAEHVSWICRSRPACAGAEIFSASSKTSWTQEKHANKFFSGWPSMAYQIL